MLPYNCFSLFIWRSPKKPVSYVFVSHWFQAKPILSLFHLFNKKHEWGGLILFHYRRQAYASFAKTPVDDLQNSTYFSLEIHKSRSIYLCLVLYPIKYYDLSWTKRRQLKNLAKSIVRKTKLTFLTTNDLGESRGNRKT